MKNQLFKVSLLAMLVTITSACTFDGDDGATGAAGAAGVVGTAGADGTNGLDGVDGEDGAPGTNGNSAVYTVHFNNLTFNQPMSPAAVILHEPGYHAFVDGETASVGIEMLAEAADPAMLISEATASANYLDSASTGSGTNPRSTSAAATLVVPDLDVDNLRLSFASMLGNTNDGFTGLNAMDVSGMAVGDSTSFMAPTWDAGTELNLESASTVPGPAASAAGGGGASAGFNAARDDLFDRVHFHSGVVSNANADDASMEGLSSSVLDESHRWNNPTAKITITRTR
ncbi:spondin domain-containing protein [Pseudocolwellia sp. HL-MZ19]|uniref:spondin domain-containing protein n=1 Tax=unclassified Pseudocolwellia TaxID=2848178 RepID=UPI003CF549A2